MIDVFGSRAAHGSIDCPIVIQSKEIDEIGRLSPALRLDTADSFARVFDHLASGRNGLASVDSPAVNPGRGELQGKIRVFGINSGRRRIAGVTTCGGRSGQTY